MCYDGLLIVRENLGKTWKEKIAGYLMCYFGTSLQEEPRNNDWQKKKHVNV
jgi:hypothetical protein